MKELIEGVRRFREVEYPARRPLFEKLAAGQSPKVLFITCSDSRINPALLTQTEPGDMFVIRNAGNLVPAYGRTGEGVSASVEYAVAVLKVSDIVICGHSDCGAVKGLLNPEGLSHLSQVAEWLWHAKAALAMAEARYPNARGAELLKAAIEENVRAQMTNLETHPPVAAARAAGKLRIHGWVHDIGSGDVAVFDPAAARFVPLDARRESTDSIRELQEI